MQLLFYYFFNYTFSFKATTEEKSYTITEETSFGPTNNNNMNSFTCLPTFQLKHRVTSPICLQIKSHIGTKGILSWEKCNETQKEQQWVKSGSKDGSEMMQICLFDAGYVKCLTSSNETEDESRVKYVYLTVYHNNVKASDNVKANHLWKITSNHRQILNYAESDSCLGYFEADSYLNLLVIAPCKDQIPSIPNYFIFKPINDKKNSEICTDFPKQNPTESAMFNVNSNNSFYCQPTFYFKKSSSGNSCLQINYDGKNAVFNWSKCNKNQIEQRWVNVGSKKRPGWMQICSAHQKKCLIDNKGVPSFINYKSTAEDNAAQLWKMNSLSQLENADSKLCLMDNSLPTQKNVGMALVTTECKGPASPYKEWFFLPLYDSDLHRICADFQIFEKNLIGNRRKFSLR